jgi:ABC-type multidrug transport system ATPase subunit
LCFFVALLLLTVDHLTKTFGRRRVLSDVSFNVRAGEVLGLIGPNGAGKTTVLECLAGLLPLTSGVVAGGERPHASRKELLFYVPDGILPWPEQSVSWVLKFFEKLYGCSREKRAALTDALRLQELGRARIATLSKGERKRLLLALGLLTSQSLLLLDEPFDGLDLRQTREVMTLLRKESASGRSLLVSIHQLNDAAKVCDRLVLLNAGERVAEGTLSELQQQANLSEGGLEEIFLALT